MGGFVSAYPASRKNQNFRVCLVEKWEIVRFGSAHERRADESAR